MTKWEPRKKNNQAFAKAFGRNEERQKAKMIKWQTQTQEAIDTAQMGENMSEQSQRDRAVLPEYESWEQKNRIMGSTPHAVKWQTMFVQSEAFGERRVVPLDPDSYEAWIARTKKKDP